MITRANSDGSRLGLGGDKQAFLQQRRDLILAHAVRQRVIDERSGTVQ